MPKFQSPLNNLRIASPCSADWDAMYGDDRKRFCGDCKLNVYNLSGMTRDEAESLIVNAEGRLCVRMFQRQDGTLITKDCPVGWERVKQRTRLFASAAVSLLAAMISGVFFVSLLSRAGTTMGELRVPTLLPTPTPIRPLMGVMPLPPNNQQKDDESKPDTRFNIGRTKALAGDQKQHS